MEFASQQANDVESGNTSAGDSQGIGELDTVPTSQEEQEKRFLGYANKALSIKKIIIVPVLAVIIPELVAYFKSTGHHLPNISAIILSVISILPDLGFVGKDQRRGINTKDTLCWVLSFCMMMTTEAFHFYQLLGAAYVSFGLCLFVILLAIIVPFFLIGFPNGITSKEVKYGEAHDSDLTFAFKLSADITTSSCTGLVALALIDNFMNLRQRNLVFRYYELLAFFAMAVGSSVMFLASLRPNCDDTALRDKLITGLKYIAYSSVVLQVLAQIVAAADVLGIYISLSMIIGGCHLLLSGILRCCCDEEANSVVPQEYKEHLLTILSFYNGVLPAIYSMFSGKEDISIYWRILMHLTLSASISVLSIMVLINCKLPHKMWAEKVLKFSRRFNQMVVSSPLIYLLFLLFMIQFVPSFIIRV